MSDKILAGLIVAGALLVVGLIAYIGLDTAIDCSGMTGYGRP